MGRVQRVRDTGLCVAGMTPCCILPDAHSLLRSNQFTPWHSRDSRNSRYSKARSDLGQGKLGMVWRGHHGWPPGEPAGQPQCEKRKVSLFQDVTRRITLPAFFMAWLERQCKHLLGHLHAGKPVLRA